MTRPVALVLRALGLGDLVTAVPALRALRAALPEHRILLAAPSSLSGLVTTIDAVDGLHPTRELMPVSWAGPAPDVAVNLHGSGPQSHRLMLELTPRRLVAFARPDLGVDGPAWDDDEHERRRWCRLISSTWDVDADADDVLLPPPSVAPLIRGAAVVHPGAAASSRRWPPERFAVVARWLRAQGFPVVITGSERERPLAARVTRAAGLPVGANLAGRTPLVTLAATVAAARIVISNDTGVAHLAGAYRVPSVVLFGPTPPWLWGPPADGPHVSVTAPPAEGEAERGDPHAHVLDPRLARIQASEVVMAAAGLLGIPATDAVPVEANQSTVRARPS